MKKIQMCLQIMIHVYYLDFPLFMMSFCPSFFFVKCSLHVAAVKYIFCLFCELVRKLLIKRSFEGPLMGTDR